MKAEERSMNCLVSSDTAILLKRLGYNKWASAAWLVSNPKRPLLDKCGSCKNSDLPDDMCTAPTQMDAASWIAEHGATLYLNSCKYEKNSWWECRYYIMNGENSCTSPDAFNHGTISRWPAEALEKGILLAIKTIVKKDSVMTAEEMDQMDAYLEEMRKNDVRISIDTYNPLDHVDQNICSSCDSRSYRTIDGRNADC